MNATEYMFRGEEAKRQEFALHLRYMHFFEKWAPAEGRAEFDADLMMLVHSIHAEALKPYEALMAHAMALVPPLATAIKVPK